MRNKNYMNKRATYKTQIIGPSRARQQLLFCKADPKGEALAESNQGGVYEK